MFNVDGNEYHILRNAVRELVGVPGLSCEIGLRLGGGSKMIMDEFIKNSDQRIHIAIDPYGNIPYTDINGTRPCGYDNRMRNECMVDLFGWSASTGQHLIFFQLESSEFFKRFADGVPIYQGGKEVETKYALVHIDGQHALPNVSEEFAFFKDRMSPGGIIVFDDINNYDHDALERHILTNGYTLLSGGTFKKAYRRDENHCVS